MNYDVIITGGGIAGLSLARQLKMTNDKLSIAVLDKEEGPFKSAAHKVGESSVEVGAYYYAQVLQLEDYIEESHYEKFGLRYFFSSESDDFSTRPEFGVDEFLPAKSYQFNRGIFENYLRELIQEQGVHLIEGACVKDILINKGNLENEVVYDKDDEEISLKANWVVDATGRKRFIQNKYGYAKKASKVSHSSSWFRVKGRCNIDDIVSKTNTEWHNRVKESRWFSTNHMMGEGYWVWLIPLKGDYTSIGIVASEEYHNFSTFNTQKKALNWISQNEKDLSDLLKGFEIIDFKAVRNYSHSSTKMFSSDGWACVGEAGMFADPFYSVGNNLIAYANGITTNLICSQIEDIEKHISYYNAFFISLCENLTYNIQISMPYMNNGKIMSLKIIWDYYIGWGVSDALFYHDIYLNPEKSRVVSQLLSRVIIAQHRITDLFTEWSKKSLINAEFKFIDYLKDLPTLATIFQKNLPPKKDNFSDALAGIRYSIDKIEEFANLLFFMAIEELYPDEFAKIEVKWVDITKISLDKNKWNQDGLFEQKSTPRDLQDIQEEISSALNLYIHDSV